MNATRRVAALAVLIVVGSLPALAWAPETRMGMVDDAIKLMPQSLRIALQHHRRDVLRGALEPLVDEDRPEHRAPWAGGTLDGQLEAEARALVALLERKTPFEQISLQFGRLSHFVMDAAFPPGVSRGDGDARYAHFADFCEQRRPKFRLVFYGHEDDRLDVADFRAYALEVMRRSSAEDEQLARAYAAAGDPPDPRAFDDRSIPFAVGSLAYSRCVNDIVRVWLTAWRLAGGDFGRTPYLSPEAEASTPGGP
jgi:hypothetical protein